MLGNLVGQRGGGQADAGPEFKNVNSPQHFFQDAGHAACGVEPCSRNLEQSGLAGAVGSEDYPAFAFLDLPVHFVEERFGSADNADASHFKNITHRSRH
ncbi:hypothetical protein D9M72_531880 [compost metagenome]